jgi:hypothetical protein
MAALEEQTVWLDGMRLCSPALSPTQDKTAKAEEEAVLLEEQSQHYKDQLDKALRQIEKLSANSQSVGHISSPSFFDPDCFPRMARGHVHGCSLIVVRMKLKLRTPCIQSCHLPPRSTVSQPRQDLPVRSRLRSKSQVTNHRSNVCS